MEASVEEGYFKALDYVAYKNKQSMTAWAERLWQRQRKGAFSDPRDEQGRRSFRQYISKVNDLRQVARNLHEKHS